MMSLLSCLLTNVRFIVKPWKAFPHDKTNLSAHAENSVDLILDYWCLVASNQQPATQHNFCHFAWAAKTTATINTTMIRVRCIYVHIELIGMQKKKTKTKKLKKRKVPVLVWEVCFDVRQRLITSEKKNSMENSVSVRKQIKIIRTSTSMSVLSTCKLSDDN